MLTWCDADARVDAFGAPTGDVLLIIAALLASDGKPQGEPASWLISLRPHSLERAETDLAGLVRLARPRQHRSRRATSRRRRRMASTELPSLFTPAPGGPDKRTVAYFYDGELRSLTLCSAPSRCAVEARRAPSLAYPARVASNGLTSLARAQTDDVGAYAFNLGA